MIKFTILSFFTIFQSSHSITPPPGQTYGAFGQLCPEPIPNKVQCETNYGSIALPTTTGATADPGLLDCGRPGDCCLCSKMECGTLTDPCHTVAIGENGAFGVRSISVLGDNTLGGSNFECMGTTACAYTYVQGTAISELACAADYSCYNAVMKITDPAVGFGIECIGKGACEGLQIELYYPPPVNGICDPTAVNNIFNGGVECMGDNACNNLVFTVNNKGCDNILIEAIHCPGTACNGARFVFIGSVGIDYCELPATGVQPIGLEKCFQNIRELACAGTECQNQIRSLSVVNNFELICEGNKACMNAQYTIGIMENVNEPVKNVRFICSANGACDNAMFMIDNYSVEMVTVTVECIGNNACDSTKFSSMNKINTQFNVVCENPVHCRGCMYNGIPCDTNANVPNKPNTPGGPNVV